MHSGRAARRLRCSWRSSRARWIFELDRRGLALCPFQAWSALFSRTRHGVLVAFGCRASRSLAAPAQPLTHDVAHPRRPVRDASDVLDHLDHALQGRQIGRVAVATAPSANAGPTCASCSVVTLGSRPARRRYGATRPRAVQSSNRAGSTRATPCSSAAAGPVDGSFTGSGNLPRKTVLDGW
jgi:hypothetical protein